MTGGATAAQVLRSCVARAAAPAAAGDAGGAGSLVAGARGAPNEDVPLQAGSLVPGPPHPTAEAGGCTGGHGRAARAQARRPSGACLDGQVAPGEPCQMVEACRWGECQGVSGYAAAGREAPWRGGVLRCSKSNERMSPRERLATVLSKYTRVAR